MAGTVSMTGLVSDTNWTNLITDMLNAEKSATITPLQNTKTAYQSKLSAWQSFNTKLSSVTSYIESSKLNKSSGYNLFSSSLTSTDASITASSILGVSLGTVSGPGSYSIEVTRLAKAEKIGSDAFTSSTEALGLTGDIVVGNKAVHLEATDGLSTVAGKINNSAAGVTATIVKVSDSDYRLQLESAATGAAGITLKNGSSADLVQALKLRTTVESVANASGNSVAGDKFADSASAVGTLLGLTSAQSGTIQIKGSDGVAKDVGIDLSTDSLQTIADNINAAGIADVAASVETVTVNGSSSYRLKIANSSTAPITGDFQDTNNILETLGVLKSAATTTIRSGQDALLSIDGYATTSSSNAVGSAIGGVTLNLTGTNVGKPVVLTISQDSSKVSQTATNLVTGLNSVLAYIKDQNTRTTDSSGNATVPALFGDNSLKMIKSAISGAMFNEITSNSVYKTASSIGITYQKDGTIAVDSGAFLNALASNKDETLNVLRSLNDNLFTALDGYVDPATGTLVSTTKSIQSQMDHIDTRISDLNARYDRQQTTLEQKFNALEVLISQSNTTKNWLTQQVAGLTKSSS
jgi:flagellar hook-associated protein 2